MCVGGEVAVDVGRVGFEDLAALALVVAALEKQRGHEDFLELGVEHEYVEAAKGHCNLDYAPVLKFMSDRLVFQ